MTIPKTNIHHTMEALRILAPIIEEKANEIALAEQQESEYITAEQARELGDMPLKFQQVLRLECKGHYLSNK